MLIRKTEILTKNGRSATPLNLDDYLSAAQYRQILSLACELECDADQASRTLFEISTEALSESAADDLIEYLKRLKG